MKPCMYVKVDKRERNSTYSNLNFQNGVHFKCSNKNGGKTAKNNKIAKNKL